MSQLDLMKQVAEGKISAEEAHKMMNAKKVKLKVSTKGAVQIDGLRRFPVTLYKGEMEQILSMADEIKQFISDNKDKLNAKGE